MTKSITFQSHVDAAKFISTVLGNDWTKVLSIVYDAVSGAFVIFYNGDMGA